MNSRVSFRCVFTSWNSSAWWKPSGIYHKRDGIHLKLIATSPSAEESKRLIAELEKKMLDRIGKYVWGFDEDQFGEALIKVLVPVSFISACFIFFFNCLFTDLFINFATPFWPCRIWKRSN